MERIPSIATLFLASFPAALEEMLSGKEWVTDDMNLLQAAGRIEIIDSRWDQPVYIFDVPVTWTRGDEAKNPELTQRLALVKALCENAVWSAEDNIAMHLRERPNIKFLISQWHKHRLSHAFPIPGQNAFACFLSCAITMEPMDV